MSPEDLKIEQFNPADILKPYVKAFMIIESDQQTKNRLLPDTSIVLAFRLRGKVADLSQNGNNNLSASVITGLRRSVRFLSYDEHTSNLLVIFKEGGAAALFKEPMNELFGQSIPLDELVPRCGIQMIEEQLGEARSTMQKISIIERFLIARLNEKRSDKLIAHAIREIRLVNGNIKIKSLAQDMAISLDPFEKRFRRATGISPKQFADTVRLRNAISQFSAAGNFTELALNAGYFDQAHFIKDFRVFAGLAPQQFFRTATWW